MTNLKRLLSYDFSESACFMRNCLKNQTGFLETIVTAHMRAGCDGLGGRSINWRRKKNPISCLLLLLVASVLPQEGIIFKRFSGKEGGIFSPIFGMEDGTQHGDGLGATCWCQAGPSTGGYPNLPLKLVFILPGYWLWAGYVALNNVLLFLLLKILMKTAI